MMAASTLRRLAWLVALISMATACRKPRGWSLTPTTPITLTMSALGNHVDLRVSISLPPNYQREPGGIASDAEWKTPERRRNEDRSPLLTLSINGESLSNGCSLRNGDAPDTLSVQQVRPDLLVSRCGSKATGRVDFVRAFHTMKLPETQRSITLWCSFVFYGEYESRDLDDAASICSSIQWNILDTQLPQDPNEPASGQRAGKPSR